MYHWYMYQYFIYKCIDDIPLCKQNEEIPRVTNSFWSNNMGLYCLICKNRILKHAKMVTCSHCESVMHMKCITLSQEEQSSILSNLSSWLCECCTISIFPFNCIEEEQEFIQTMNYELSHCEIKNLMVHCQKIFHPFEISEGDDETFFISDIDPDTNYFNQTDFKITNNCLYYNEDKFNSEYAKVNAERIIKSVTNPFSMCHVNIRSVPKNFGHFEDYLSNLNHNFTFIGLSETWLTESNKEIYHLKGYNVATACRENKKGGGVALFIQKSLSYRMRDYLNVLNDNIEAIFVEIEKGEWNLSKNIVVGVLYKPPNTDLEMFVEYLSLILDKIDHEKKLSYIMGDYNINLLNHDSHPNTALFLDTLYCKSFVPLITKPTRSIGNSHTLIDYIITNNIEELQYSMQGIFLTDIGDHYPIFSLNWRIQDKTIDLVSWQRSMSFKNYNKFKQLLAQTNWADVYRDMAFEKFHVKLKLSYDKAFPNRKMTKTYHTRKPWLTEALQNSIKIKKIRCI